MQRCASVPSGTEDSLLDKKGSETRLTETGQSSMNGDGDATVVYPVAQERPRWRGLKASVR
ncbi:MAG: hypothetical protein ACE5H4_04850 [Candidatus Thorarchaeota archaeon]